MKTQKGFTLVEAAIAILIASIVMTGVLGTFVSIVKSNQHASLRAIVDRAKGEVLLNTAKTKVCEPDCVYTVTLPTLPYPDTWGVPLQITLAAGAGVIDKNTVNGPVVFIRSLGPDFVLGGGDDYEVVITASELLYMMARTGL